MAFRTTPQLGPQLDEAFDGLPYWDGALGVSTAATDLEPSYKLGNREHGDDGYEYIWVTAPVEIAATAVTGTEVDVDLDTFEATVGAGGYFTPADTVVPAGGYVHVRIAASLT